MEYHINILVQHFTLILCLFITFTFYFFPYCMCCMFHYVLFVGQLSEYFRLISLLFPYSRWATCSGFLCGIQLPCPSLHYILSQVPHYISFPWPFSCPISQIQKLCFVAEQNKNQREVLSWSGEQQQYIGG